MTTLSLKTNFILLTLSWTNNQLWFDTAIRELTYFEKKPKGKIYLTCTKTSWLFKTSTFFPSDCHHYDIEIFLNIYKDNLLHIKQYNVLSYDNFITHILCYILLATTKLGKKNAIKLDELFFLMTDEVTSITSQKAVQVVIKPYRQ